MLSTRGNNLLAKVSDFGLAKHVDPVTRITEAAGTLAYLPPEGFGIMNHRPVMFFRPVLFFTQW